MKFLLLLLMLLVAPAWSLDLSRVKVGNQAGILKILDAQGHTAFLKGSESWNGGGIDDRKWAPINPQERDRMLSALHIADPDAAAVQLMTGYAHEKRKAEAVAVLGLLALPGQTSPPLKNRTRVLQFFRNRLGAKENAVARRQAVLALALQPATERSTVDAMIAFLKRDHNAWNTFGAVQYFDYQRGDVLAFPDAELIKKKIRTSGSPHTEQILRLLQLPQESNNGMRTPAESPPGPPATTPMPGADPTSEVQP